jgi:transposase
MANFFSILNALKEIYHFSIIIVDHFKKHTNNLRSDSDLQSGSGVKSDLSDADIILRNSCQNKHWRLLKRIKSRLVEESDSTKLIALNPETLWFELIKDDVNEAEHIGLSEIQDKDELKDIAFDMHEKGSTLDEIARAIHKGKSTVHRYINERKPAT